MSADEATMPSVEDETIEECMLSTIDNEWNPFDNFGEWYTRDEELARQQNRRSASGYMAIIASVAEDVSDREYNQVISDAIDEILALNLSGTFIKVTRKTKPVYVTED